MKTLVTEEWVLIPDGGKYKSQPLYNYVCLVTVTVRQRIVTVKGPRGEITKDFRHIPVELTQVKQTTRTRKGNYLNLKMWFGTRKQACSVTTLKSLIRNMVTGVTQVR